MRLLVVGLLALTLGACTARDAGQTIYNSGAAYCANSPHECGQNDTGKRHGGM